MATTTDAQTIPSFDFYDAPIASVEFKNAAGVLTDPSAVTFETKDPDGSVVTYTDASPEVTNPSTGVWQLQVPVVTVSGTWIVRGRGTAGLTAADVGKFYVEPDPFA